MRSLLLFAAASTLGACTLDFETGETTQGVETHNRLAQNRLAQNRLAQNRLAQNRLAQNSLQGLTALDDTSQILQTPGGREVYSYLTTCALAEDVVIHAEVPDAADTAPPDTVYTCTDGHCTFPGGLGLAPRWLDHKLNPIEQRWVSACIFARVNFHATAEAISLRGKPDGLAVSVDEAELYNLQEGAFFGNLFTDIDEPIDWNACRGADQAVSEDGGLALRDCTEPGYVDPENPLAPPDPTRTKCGFKYAGDCGDYFQGGGNDSACSVFDPIQGTYDKCEGTGKSRTYRQVITSYVAP